MTDFSIQLTIFFKMKRISAKITSSKSVNEFKQESLTALVRRNKTWVPG